MDRIGNGGFDVRHRAVIGRVEIATVALQGHAVRAKEHKLEIKSSLEGAPDLLSFTEPPPPQRTRHKKHLSPPTLY